MFKNIADWSVGKMFLTALQCAVALLAAGGLLIFAATSAMYSSQENAFQSSARIELLPVEVLTTRGWDRFTYEVNTSPSVKITGALKFAIWKVNKDSTSNLIPPAEWRFASQRMIDLLAEKHIVDKRFLLKPSGDEYESTNAVLPYDSNRDLVENHGPAIEVLLQK